jgi:hypothetical protein
MSGMDSSAPRLGIGGGRFRAPLVGATLLLHALLLWVFVSALRAPAAPETAVNYIALVDIPVPKVTPPAAAPPEAAPAPRKRPLKRPVRTGMTVVPAPSPLASVPDAAPSADVPPLEDSKPAFNREAALAAARTMTSLPDPARAGTPLAQFDARKQREETEQEKLGRKIAGAKRSDCIGPNASGNLLTPLMWLLDKKGGGCKF